MSMGSKAFSWSVIADNVSNLYRKGAALSKEAWLKDKDNINKRVPLLKSNRKKRGK